MLTQFEIGWLVGLLEGEGTFRFQNRTCHVVIKITDEDTMYRYIEVVRKLTGRTYDLKSYDRAHENRQQIYQVNICGGNARLVMKTIVPHMSYRRRQCIWQSLNGHRAKKLSLEALFPSTVVKENVVQIRRRV